MNLLLGRDSSMIVMCDAYPSTHTKITDGDSIRKRMSHYLTDSHVSLIEQQYEYARTLVVQVIKPQQALTFQLFGYDS